MTYIRYVYVIVGGTEQNRYLSLLLFVNWYFDSFLENFGKLCSRIFFLQNILTNLFWADLLDVRSRTNIWGWSISLFYLKIVVVNHFLKSLQFLFKTFFFQNILMNLFLRSIVGRIEQDRYLRMIHPSPKGIDSFVQKHQHKERLEIYK